MKKALPIGISNYERLMSDGYYSVDKTLMIQEFLKRKSAVTLITRPRRFGKTLNMSMMTEFFDITKDSHQIFEHTKIMKTEYASEINQYPTLFISFAGAKDNKEKVIQHVKNELQNEYERYDYIFHNMNKFEQHNYDMIVNQLLDSDGQFDALSHSLSFLMKMLENYYHKKVMLFIDEYDTPFIEAHVGGFYDEIRGHLVSLLHNALKDNDHLQYAMMTGIQRVAKENIFSDLNHLVVYTVNDEGYSQYFGFSEEETFDLLEFFDLKLNQEVKEMYDGYHIGNQDIYNPWSIINYAQRRQLEPYWVNTSANKMIKKAMVDSDLLFRKGYEFLIENQYLETQVLLETSFYEVSSTEALWGLFVNAGYLTLEKRILGNRYRLRIPNQEVQEEFKSLTAEYLHVSNTSFNDLFYALYTEDPELFIESYRSLLTLPSYHDLQSENSYHMIMLGMCAWLSNEYEIISNREAGKGRCDIILKTRKKGFTSYVFEFKYMKKDISNEKLEQTAKKAVQQIIEQRYDEGLKGKVIFVGLAHGQKDVIMEWIER